MSPAQRTSAGRGCLLLVAAALVGGCGTAPEKAVPRVEYARCQRAFAGPVCMLPESRRLTLWVEAPPHARIEIAADGQPLAASGVEAGLGLRYKLELAGEPRKLTVRVEGSPPWELALSAPGSTWWEDANRLFFAGDLDAARAVVDEARATGIAEPGRELSARARIALWSGDSDGARELLERAIRAHRESGEYLQETHDVVALFNLLSQQDLAATRQALAALPRDWNGPAEATYDAAYFPALVAGETGDLGAAVRLLRTAFEEAERMGLRIYWLESGQVLARQLQELGRGSEARPLMARLIDGLSEDLYSCFRGQMLTNLGWTSLLALEGGEPAEDPTRLFEKAQRIFERDCPQLPDERLNATLNLALAHLHAGRLPEARQCLRETAEQGKPTDWRLALWRREIEARVALEAGSSEEAFRRSRELAELAGAELYPEVRWRATLDEARALVSLGRRSEALAAFAEAERRLDEAALMVPLTEGRAAFVRQREEGIRRYVDLLIDTGNAVEALAVARRARLRVLRGLLREGRLSHLSPAEQERWDRAVSSYRSRRAALDAEAAGDWQLSRDLLRRRKAQREAANQELLRDLDGALAMLDRRPPEPGAPPPGGLPTPAAGELQLLYHPLPEGWAGFALDEDGLVARRLACRVEELAPQQLGECLLAPFADRIAAARRFRLLPYGSLRQVDFHALPYGGDVLLAAGPVVYGLDLERRGEPPALDPPQALLIADPGGDLPAARREADAVAAALSPPAGAWQVRELRGAAAAAEAVRDLLPHADLLHYSGHAVFAGLGGWESALPLAGGGRLTVGDVLTLARAPRWVVLSGCETGGTAQHETAETVSLAHAFLAAGSEAVVAATRPVADATAYRLIAAFYREWSAGAPADEALRTAQLALRREDPGADWASFRLIAH